MINKRVLLIGYGSIGKRHARNLADLGITPYVLTKYPDNLNAKFLKDKDMGAIKNNGIKYCIIASPTARHLDDLRKCLKYLNGLKKVLIEKPLECSYSKGKEIIKVAKAHKLEVFTAYNLRFIDAFDAADKFLKKYKDDIKIVEVVAGQDLREWRPYRDIRKSYSAHRRLGGGVDLDLSHEIDYVLWLFGDSFKNRLMHRSRISNLKINSPDIFKLVLDYKRFVVDITLDYIRKPKERHLRIICAGGKDLYYDFVAGSLKINGKIILDGDDINESYTRMLRGFLGIDKIAKRKLCSAKEGLKVLRVLEV